MFGKKKVKYVGRIHLDVVKSETVKMKPGDEFEVFATNISKDAFDKRIEELAYQCSLTIVSNTSVNHGEFISKLRRV